MSRTIEEWINEISEWQDSIFTTANPISAAIHLTREALEVQASAKNGQTSELAFELADVFMLTVSVAHLAEVDLEKAIEMKMEVNRSRDWAAPDRDGVVEHIRLGVCSVCAGPMPMKATGRPKTYCGPACRQRAYRQRAYCHLLSKGAAG